MLRISPHTNAEMQSRPEPMFPFFPSLPPELRHQVWEGAVDNNEPRIISLATIPAAKAIRLYDEERKKIPPFIPPADIKLVAISAQSGLFNACFDSRQVLLKQKDYLFGDVCANLDVDTIHFGPNFEKWQLSAFARTIGREKAMKVRRLVLEYEVLDLTTPTAYPMSCDLVEICQMFGNLEKLIFVPWDEGLQCDRFKMAKLRLVELKPRSDTHWSRDSEDGTISFAQDAASVIRFSLRMRAQNLRLRDPESNLAWKTPEIEFMEIVEDDKE